MRKLARLAASLIATGAVSVAGASSAVAYPYPPPCPPHQIVSFSSGSVTITPGCYAFGKVGPITLPTPSRAPAAAPASFGAKMTPGTTMPPPCPVSPLISVRNGNIVIQYGCLAPIVIPIPAISRGPLP